jgi:hypothetical protein
MTERHDHGGEDALEALVEEFSDRRTYRPTDDAVEPDEMPRGPSGTALGDSAPTGSGAVPPEAR